MSAFQHALLDWYHEDDRPLPWKGERDPYLIWLSEIILQQTRAEQGLPYYEKFKAAYPRVEDLAAAPEDEVMKLWQGLGYYSRARNLQYAAKTIVEEHKGQFPSTYESIIALKGVGSYTAAAIASFGFGLPYAVVDGNVIRVLSRVFDIDAPYDNAYGKKLFQQLADEHLDSHAPGRYNQAIMDFGASVCKPKQPLCSQCPMHTFCGALRKKTVDQRPVKAKKLVKRHRYFHFLLVTRAQQIAVQQRAHKDIWQHLYQFPLIESDQWLDHAQMQQNLTALELGDAHIQHVSAARKQTLTHQYIHAKFYTIQPQAPFEAPKSWLFVDNTRFKGLALPKIIADYVSDSLNLD